MRTITKTITYNLCAFSELSKAAQDKAVQEFSARQWDDFNPKEDESYFKAATLLGFHVDPDDLYWSGFSSQGDGASFEGQWNAFAALKAVDAITKEFPKDTELHRIAAAIQELAHMLKANGLTEMDDNFAIRRTRFTHYCYAYTMTATYHGGWEFGDAGNDELTGLAQGFARWIYMWMELDWNARSSAKALMAYEADYGIMFREDGSIVWSPDEEED